mgnify:CR=1 FL=1|tara:strand:- start:102 stop:536 length:435 start_codon:yes stop_codon:yes gene_type:complete
MLIRKQFNKMTKKELIAYTLTIEYLYFNLKDELEPLAKLVPHLEKWKNHHLDTIKEYHKRYEQERVEEELVSPIYATEKPSFNIEWIQQTLDTLELSDRTREVLQVLSSCKTQQEASDILGISQAAISKHISKAKVQYQKLYGL